MTGPDDPKTDAERAAAERAADEPASAIAPGMAEEMPIGFFARMRARWRHLARPAQVGIVAVVLLLAVTAGLGFAVLTSERPIAGASPSASPAATVAPSDSAAPTSSPSGSPSPSATASASASATDSVSASAAASAPAETTPSPTPQGAWAATGSLIEARINFASAPLADGRVLVAGGNPVVRGDFLSSAEILRPGDRGMERHGPMPSARSHYTATVLADGRVLIAGGYGDSTAGNYLKSAALFDPATERWTATDDMVQAHGLHTATRLTERERAGRWGRFRHGHVRACVSRGLRRRDRALGKHRPDGRAARRAHRHTARRRHGPGGGGR